MFKYKNMRKFFSFILSVSILFSITMPSLASNTKIAAVDTYAVFNALPDDAIVCYLFGEPVYKYEIDENYMIIKDFSTNSRAVGEYEDTLSTTHRNEAIVAQVRSYGVGYNQTMQINYYPSEAAVSCARDFDDGIDATSLVTHMVDVLGIFATSAYKEILVQGLAIMFDYFNTQLGNVADKIYALTDSGKDVRLTTINSTSGVFYNVTEWDGSSVVRYSDNWGTGAYTVDSVKCSHGNVWS